MKTYIVSIIAVLAGYLFIWFTKPTGAKGFKLFLAFSGAFLLAITVFNLLPEIFSEGSGAKKYGIWIMIGILLQKILEYLSEGAEHGHFHVKNNKKQFPVLIYISLCLHAILEGLPLHSNENLFHAIVIHKIPIAMILTIFLVKTEISSAKILFYLVLFSIMTPIGTWMTSNVVWLQDYYEELTAMVIGIFLHVSTTILFENNEGHKFNLTKLLVILSATLVAYLL